MIGITCALFDEAYELISRLEHKKYNGFSCYTGTLCGAPVSLFLTRPGLKKNTKSFTLWLAEFSFSKVIFSGFCGSLTSKYSAGDICEISEVYSTQSNDRYFTGRNSLHKIITVNEPILDMSKREELQIKHNLDLVDMESAIICSIMKSSFPEVQYKIIKIVGDIPGEDDLMKKEINMRSFFSTFGLLKKLRIAYNTGPSFFNLYHRKRFLQKTLKNAICIEIIKGSNE